MIRATQAFCFFLLKQIAIDLPVQSTPQGWKYFELSDFERCTHHDGKLTRQQVEEHYIQFTTAHGGAHRSLLMHAVGQVRLTVNGLPAARYQALRPGDVVRIEDDPLQLSIRNRPYVGSPQASDLGTACGYCRTSITERPGARVYICPNCQLPTHFDDEQVAEEERLICFAMSTHCGHCQAELIAREGFSHVPAL